MMLFSGYEPSMEIWLSEGFLRLISSIIAIIVTLDEIPQIATTIIETLKMTRRQIETMCFQSKGLQQAKRIEIRTLTIGPDTVIVS
jgi:hypothetical protein